MSEPTTSSPSRSSLAGWIAAGVCLLAAAGAGVYGAYQHNLLADVELRLIDAVTKLQASEERVEAVQNESNAIRTNLSMLASPDTVEVRLTGKGATPDAVGRVFVSKLKGILFSAAKLKPLGENDEYQLWLLTKGAPVNVGTMRANADGNITAAFDMPADAGEHTGFSVTIEPEGGSKAPKGAVALGS